MNHFPSSQLSTSLCWLYNLERLKPCENVCKAEVGTLMDGQPIKGAGHPVYHKGLLDLPLVTINM